MAYEEHLRRVAERRERLQADLEAISSSAKEVELEVGCGHGHWLAGYAAQRPERLCLGLDICGDRIERAKRKAARAEVANARFLKAEAAEAVELLPEGVEIGAVYILFPDPWPKKRHWKNRIMNPSFLALLATRCAAGARLHFRTDHEGYFSWAEEQLEDVEGWRRDEGARWPFERETVFQSKAESFQSMILARAEA